MALDAAAGSTPEPGKAAASRSRTAPQLAPGSRLGVYRVVRALGSGGMGEVYLVDATRLNRQVALKILPRAVADDPGRRERFDREAQAAAPLTHPNIAPRYLSDTSDGLHPLTTEYIERE